MEIIEQNDNWLMRYIFFFNLLFILFGINLSFSQGLTCSTTEPFCAGDTTLIFENSSGSGSAEFGPDYGCLGTQPNPAWYFIQIDQPGNLSFNIVQNSQADLLGTPLDVDFIAYGPFSNTNACSNLTAANTVDCSYLPDAVENFNITNAQAGEIYVLLITNFSGAPGFIQLQQTNAGNVGSGSTDCSIVNTIHFCEGEITSLDATTDSAVVYEWFKDGNLLSETGPILNNVATPSAVYTVNALDGLNNIIIDYKFILEFHTVPIAGVANNLLECDDNNDGISEFDLTSTESAIIGTQDVTQFSISYHTSQSDADKGTNAIPNPTTFTNTTNPQTIYVRIDNNGNNDCFDTTSFSIEVFETPTANMVNDILQCDDNNDGISDFDLTSLEPDLLGTQDATQFTVTYHTNQADATTDINAIPNPATFTNTTNPQTIYVRIDNNDNNDCFDTTSFLVEVFDTPTVNSVIDFVLCDNLDDGDDINGEVIFDLSTKINEVLGTQSITDFEVKFYYTQAEADAGIVGSEITTPIQNTINPQSIVVRIENRINTNCYDTALFNLIVLELPVVEPLVELFQCDDDIDGFTNFNLEEANELFSTEFLNETFSHYNSLIDAENGSNAIVNTTSYLNTDSTSNPDKLYVRIENSNGCFRVSQLNLIVSTTQIPSDYQLLFEVCDDTLIDGDNRNGIAAFDFSDADVQIANLFPLGQTITITYYESITEALAEINPILNTNDYRNDLSPDLQSIIVRVDSDLDNSCLGLGEHIILQVNPLPIIDLEDEYLLCINTNGTETVELPIIDTGLSETEYTFEWSLNNSIIVGSTLSTYAPTEGGTYSVLVTNITTGCQYINDTLVFESEPPIVSVNLTSLAFADNHVIEAVADGNGIYEYSLDNGSWQESGIFENITPGEHIVTAIDLNGCGINSASIIVIDFPMYFTPNRDGFNDTWNIIGLENQPSAKIYIYDRYGKLLKQISPSSLGWDGTFNNYPLPTSDYWFTVEFIEPKDGLLKQFQAHFTLKR